MESLLGLVDAENVPIAFIHYVAPAVIILVFLIASISSAVVSPSTTAPSSRSQLQTHGNLTVGLSVIVLFTFVLSLW